jgi:hypothetical protein
MLDTFGHHVKIVITMLELGLIFSEEPSEPKIFIMPTLFNLLFSDLKI